MTDPDNHDRLDDLGKRIEAAKEKRRPRSGGQQSYSTSGLGVGMRIATELVAALVVSVGIGIVLDRWLGTTPWLLIAFFILGAATGFRNVVRVAQNYDAARKREREEQARGAERKRDNNGDGEG
jgi:ATP synthase protein I